MLRPFVRHQWLIAFPPLFPVVPVAHVPDHAAPDGYRIVVRARHDVGVLAGAAGRREHAVRRAAREVAHHRLVAADLGEHRVPVAGLNAEYSLLAHLFAGPELLSIRSLGKFNRLVVVFAHDLLDFCKRYAEELTPLIDDVQLAVLEFAM